MLGAVALCSRTVALDFFCLLGQWGVKVITVAQPALLGLSLLALGLTTPLQLLPPLQLLLLGLLLPRESKRYTEKPPRSPARSDNALLFASNA